MRLWQRRRPRHPQCYFCSASQEQLERSSSVQRFVCSTCGSYNALSPSGAPLDDERPAVHWDSAIPSNALSFSKRAKSTSKSSQGASTAGDTSLFCQQCRRHQSLQLYLLGAYYDNTDEDSAEDHVLQHRLQEYKDSLDSRYPSLCAACAPAVKQELSMRNTRARADILNHLVISNTAKRRRAPALGSTARRRRDPRATAQWKLQVLLWRLKGCLWALLQLLSLCGYGACMFKPALALKISATDKPTLILSLAASTFLISFWQPLWHKHRELAAAAPDPRQVGIPGRTVWLAACLCAFVVRVCTVYAALHYASRVELVTLQRLFVAAFAATCLGLSWASSRQLVMHHNTRAPQQSSRPPKPRPSHTPSSRPESPALPQTDSPARPHPLFGDWQAAQRAQSSSSVVPMDVDEGDAVEAGNAGSGRTPLEELLAGTDLQARGPFSGL